MLKKKLLNTNVKLNLLLEIKSRLTFFLIGMFCSFIICYYYKQTLLYLCIKPIFLKQNFNLFYFIFTDLIEVFLTYWLILQFFCFHFFVFIFFMHFWFFVSPSLYTQEKLDLKTSFLIITILWLVTVLTFYNFILPYFWGIFSTFDSVSSNNKKILQLFFESKLSEYIHFLYNAYTFCCIIIIIFYIICYVFHKKYITHNKFYEIKNFRNFLYFFFVVIATLFTPPDVFSQILVSLFFFIIFELLMFSLIINNIKIVYKNKLKLNNILAVNDIYATDKGKKHFQPKFIN